MKKTTLLVIAGVLCIIARSQESDSPADLLPPPAPKIYLHTDKDIYLPGETVWFKAYLLSNGFPDTLTGNLFTALVTSNGMIADSIVSPVISGGASGQFTISNNLTAGWYSLAAFTRSTVADSNNIIYSKPVFITEQAGIATEQRAKVSLQLFAEGGNFIADVENTIAFKASYSNGQPFPLRGAIKDNRGNLIDSIAATHDGMGTFIFLP